MRRSILLIYTNNLQPVVLGWKHIFEVVLQHEHALFQTHFLARNFFNISPRRFRHNPGTHGVYGSRSISGCHEEILRDTRCPFLIFTVRNNAKRIARGRYFKGNLWGVRASVRGLRLSGGPFRSDQT